MRPVSRKVEVFLEVATTREEIIQALRREACPGCEITIRDVADPKNKARAAHLGIDKLPAIVLNGKPLAYCRKPCPAGKAVREAATEMHPRQKR